MKWLIAARAILALVFGLAIAVLIVLDELKGIGLDLGTKLLLLAVVGALLNVQALTNLLPGTPPLGGGNGNGGDDE